MMLAADRKANPRDDIVTKLINADMDERGLNDDEFGYFVIMLTVAGNETTRNAITHGMNAFLDNPDQWELWKRERPATMVDEIDPLGHAGDGLPAHRPQRRRGRRRAGQEGPAGRRSSTPAPTSTRTSSRTRSRSTSPATRTRTSAFGGHGAHYCIGANLARQEVQLIFNALADHAPDITKLAEPRRLRHGWINGIKDLQVKYA